jgi:hypothetical protein
MNHLAPPRPPTLRATARTLALVAIVALLASGCRPPAERADPNRSIEVTLLTTPARVGPAAVEVRLATAGSPVAGASVRVVGDMTHAGMVPVVANAVDLGAGVYRTEGFAFDMAGDWVITAEVRYPDAVTRQGSLAVSVTR